MLLADDSVPAEAFSKLRLAKREEADDAMAFATIFMKARYDARHLPLSFKEGDEAFLKLHHGYSIPGLSNRKLSQQRVGPFKVLSKVGHLAYRLQLAPIMRIHPVISVAQLEPSATTTAGAPDPYGRDINTEPPPVYNEGDHENDESEVGRIVGKKISRGKSHYLVQWKDWGKEHNVWYSVDDLPNAMDLVNDYERREELTPATTRRGKGARKEPTTITPPASEVNQAPKRRRGRPRKGSATAT